MEYCNGQLMTEIIQSCLHGYIMYLLCTYQCTEDVTLSVPLVDPLENLLIEHPSMSVYQRRCETTEGEGLASDEEGDTARYVYYICTNAKQNILSQVSYSLQTSKSQLIQCVLHLTNKANINKYVFSFDTIFTCHLFPALAFHCL